MKRIIILFGIFYLMLFSGNPGFSQHKVRKVVIDAGHGGRDPGAVGKHHYEKDLALTIALRTGKYIEKYLPDVQVIYTRKDDRFIELHRRAQIANESKADLFISIHCNANNSSRIYGTETYVMGLHKTQANLEVAKLENAAILKEEDYADMYEGFNPNNDEDYITLSIFQNAFLDQSIELASKVEEQFSKRAGRKSRGVLQAGFWVLYKTAMPGILVETGYLSNPTEEKYLASEQGQVYLASAIYRAIKEYKLAIEADNGALEPKENISDMTEEEIIERKDVILFKVQISSSDKKMAPGTFQDVGKTEFYKQKNIYKYTVGSTTDINEAIRLQNKVRKNKKYKDAFVVAFLNGERISVNEARRMMGL